MRNNCETIEKIDRLMFANDKVLFLYEHHFQTSRYKSRIQRSAQHVQ